MPKMWRNETYNFTTKTKMKDKIVTFTLLQKLVKITLTSLHKSAITYTCDKILTFFIREYIQKCNKVH